MLLFDSQYLPQIIFELVVAIFFLIFWIDILRRSSQKRTAIAKRLSIFMTLYFLATCITILSQFDRRIMNSTLIPWLPTHYYDQTYKIFALAANYAFFLFHHQLFSKYEGEPKMKKIILASTILLILFTVIFPIFYTEFIDLGSTITSALLLVHSLIIFIPALVQSHRLYRKIDEITAKAAVFSIFLMALFFVGLWVINVFNQLWDMITERIYGPFWLLSWLTILLAIFSGYIGFVNPPWFQNMAQKLNKSGD